MRLAIVGCGLIGAKRAAAASSHEIVVVCDRDQARADALAQKTGARAVTDWREAVSAEVDAVIVATTHDQLAAISRGAVEAGRHVLVEKPAGRTLAEVQAIAAAAEKHKRIVKVGFNHRFHPAFLKAREIVDSGALGALMFIRARYGHGGRVGYEKEWRAIPAISGGGELIDQGSHLIDLSRWFLGDLTVDYAAVPTLFWNMRADDNCFMALRSSNNNSNSSRIAWLHASWTEWKNTFSFEIFGRDGKLVIDGLGGSYGLERLTHYRMLPQMGPPETATFEYPGPDQSWDAEFADFVAAVNDGRRPCGDIADAVANLAIVEEIYRRYRP
jgi:predicted dehydrogenase